MRINYVSKDFTCKGVGIILRALILIASAVLAACAANQDLIKAQHVDQPGALLEETYRIGIDDSLQINVWRNAELSVSVPVRPDGMISVPLIGDVRAGGMTPEQVAKSIREKLAAYIRDPNVTVIVTGLSSHEFLSRIRVTGAVRTPKSMPFRRGMTVLDAILEAGGVNDFAAPNRTKLYRRDKEKTRVIDIELGDILNEGKLRTNVLMLPGDIVTVPERIF
jgi:polysaccharide export outer membrane protein